MASDKTSAPKVFQMRTDAEFRALLIRVIKQQTDNPSGAEMVRRLLRYAAINELKIDPEK